LNKARGTFNGLLFSGVPLTGLAGRGAERSGEAKVRSKRSDRPAGFQGREAQEEVQAVEWRPAREEEMRSRFAEVVDFLKTVIGDFTSDDCPMMAAALAYYTVFSLAPMLLIVSWAAGWFLTPEEASLAIHGQFEGLIGAEGARQVETMLANARRVDPHGVIGKVAGIVAIVLGGTGVMLQLQASLNRAWGVRPDPKRGLRRFVLKRLLSFGMVLGVAFLLLVSLVLSAAASAVASKTAEVLPDAWSAGALEVVDFSVSFVVITSLFAAMFKILPDAVIRWRDVIVGAAFTSLLFSIGKVLIGLYVGNTDVGSTYGAASSLAVLFVWVYYSSMIVLLGAEVTQVWTTRYGRGLEPERHAVLVEHRADASHHGEDAVPRKRRRPVSDG
jgi:membrane protein